MPTLRILAAYVIGVVVGGGIVGMFWWRWSVFDKKRVHRDRG